MKKLNKLGAALLAAILVMAAWHISPVPDVSAWHTEGREFYQYEDNADDLLRWLPNEAKKAVRSQCVYRVRYVEPTRGHVEVSQGFSGGCQVRHLDSVLDIVDKLSPYSRWMERTAQFAMSDALSVSGQRLAAGETRAVLRRHISDVEFDSYVEYARDTNRIGNAIPRILHRAALMPCPVARVVAAYKFNFRDRSVWEAKHRGETIAGKSWQQIERDGRWLRPVADYICSYWRYFSRTLAWDPLDGILSPIIDAAEGQCYQPLVSAGYTNPRVVWRGDCIKGLTSSHRLLAGPHHIENEGSLYYQAETEKQKAKARGSWPSGENYSERDKYTPQVVSIWRGKCLPRNWYGCVASQGRQHND